MSRPRARCRIAELPPEVLLSIAAELHKNRDLCQLSLVNKKFQDVAQHMLFNNLKLRGNAIRKIVKTLLDRPDLAAKIRHIDIGDRESSLESPAALESFGTTELLKCLQLLRSTIDDEELRRRIISSMLSQPGTAPSETRSQTHANNGTFFLAVLLAVASRMMSLTIELPPSADVDAVSHTLLPSQTQERAYYDPFEGLIWTILRSKLDHLIISDPPSWKGSIMPSVVLEDLDVLTRLTMPLVPLARDNNTVSVPHQVLPSGLTHLELYVGTYGQFFFSFIDELILSLSKKKLVSLHSIDFYFPFSPRALINFMLHIFGPGRLEVVERTLDKLHGFGVDLTTYFGKEKELVNLTAEMKARLELTDTEAWLTATKGEQFSATVRRHPDPITRRKAMVLEARLSLSNPQDLGRLFSSPTLDVDSLSNVRFFGGVYGVQTGKKNKSRSASKPISTDENAKPVPKDKAEDGAKNGLKEEDKAKSESTAATEVQDPRSNHKSRKQRKTRKVMSRKKRTFLRSPSVFTEQAIPAGVQPPDLTFDPNKWLKVRFFDTPGNARSRQELDSKGKTVPEADCIPSPAKAIKSIPEGERQNGKMVRLW